jgi:hypothetical protein
VRLAKIQVNPTCFVGPAELRINEITQSVPKYSFAVAFVDPYNLVPFNILRQLSGVNRMDLSPCVRIVVASNFL